MKTEGANMTILPCPFCGGNGECTYVRFVECVTCGALGPEVGHDDKAGAIAAWNRRAGDAFYGLYRSVDHSSDPNVIDVTPAESALVFERRSCRPLSPGWEKLSKPGAAPSFAQLDDAWVCECDEKYPALFAHTSGNGACDKCAERLGVFAKKERT